MLNWSVWNRTVSTCELLTYAELNCFKYNLFDIETELFEIELFWHLPLCEQNLY